MNRYTILGLAFCALALLTGCAAFDAFVADPAAVASAKATAAIFVPPPWNLLLDGAFAFLVAAVAPKEPA